MAEVFCGRNRGSVLICQATQTRRSNDLAKLNSNACRPTLCKVNMFVVLLLDRNNAGRNVGAEAAGSRAQRAQLNVRILQVPCNYISSTFATCFAHARQASRKLKSRNTRASIVVCWPQTQLQCGCAREAVNMRLHFHCANCSQCEQSSCVCLHFWLRNCFRVLTNCNTKAIGNLMVTVLCCRDDCYNVVT